MKNPRETMIHGWEGSITNEEENYPLNADEIKILKNIDGEARPEIQDFSDVINKNEIERDTTWLGQQRNRKQEVVKTKRGEILEHVIRHHAEMSDWLGDNCYTVETTEYDDRANHIDFIIEWEQEDGEAVRLAIDVTTTEDPDVFDKKESLIKDEIEKGWLSRVKYFQSEIDETKGKIQNLPRAVIAVSKENIQKLCGELINKKPAELAKSPEQLLLLDEIGTQMTDQIEYSLKLLLENLYNYRNSLSEQQKDELKNLAQAAIKLEDNPEEIQNVLKILKEQKNLIGQNIKNPAITKYINTITQQEKVFAITNKLYQQKSSSLDSLIIQQAAEQKQNNIILKTVNLNLRDFHLPNKIHDLALAA